ncbi:MAG TPA: response regulator transcription factor [Armatimonadota bacterium]|nr:response regulator transcription factor [Armatimonadota bacterium]
MYSRQRTSTLTAGVRPAVRVGLIALVESDPGPGEAGRAQNSREATEFIAAQLEPLLDALSQAGRQGRALEVRATLAVLHWQSGPREQAEAPLEPASILDTLESYVRTSGEAGPARIPLPRQPEAGLRPSTRTVSQGAAPVEPLSQRELEVLCLLATGLSNKDLAAQLFLSAGTVKQHLHHINRKLGTTSRTSAVARARHLGLL